jgi:hypothetical protein
MVERRVTHEWAVDGLRSHLPTDLVPFSSPHPKGRLALVHRTAVADFHADCVSPVDGEVPLPEGEIRSDTGELTWLEAESGGKVLIDTPYHQAIIGHHGQAATTHLSVDLETSFAAVTVSSLDGRPLDQSARLLLVTAARVANTGMQWIDARRQSLGEQWGKAPTRIEPVKAMISLRSLGGRAVHVQPLDVYGQPAGEPAALAINGETCELALPMGTPTLWYQLTVDR